MSARAQPDFHTLARSVGDYLARVAEPVAEGVRWATYSYAGERQYGTDVFAGAAGVVLFLADLAAMGDDARSRDLAERGMAWLAATWQREEAAGVYNPTLYAGAAGHGQTALRLHAATREARWLDLARERARGLVSATYAQADVMSGVAGAAIFALELHRVTGEQAPLDTAQQLGRRLLDSAVSDRGGLAWDWQRRSGAVRGTGFAHGNAGIGYALIELFRFSGDPRFRDGAHAAARWLEAAAVDTPQGIGWPRFVGDPDPPRVQWCHGAPGVGLFAVRAFEITRAESFRALAARCAQATVAAGDLRSNPSQCHGLAGNAELLVEMGQILGDHRALMQAREFGVLAAAYREGAGDETLWASDEPGQFNPAFMLGAAGTGHFFLRLARPDRVTLPMMVAPIWASAARA